MKTKRNIGYDLEVISFDGKFAELLITCENGSTTAYHPVSSEDYDMHNETDDLDYIITDFTDIEKWADAREIAFVASEVARICVMKSTSEVYWSFDLMALKGIKLSVYKMKVDDGSITGGCDGTHLYSLQEINEWILENK